MSGLSSSVVRPFSAGLEFVDQRRDDLCPRALHQIEEMPTRGGLGRGHTRPLERPVDLIVQVYPVVTSTMRGLLEANVSRIASASITMVSDLPLPCVCQNHAHPRDPVWAKLRDPLENWLARQKYCW